MNLPKSQRISDAQAKKKLAGLDKTQARESMREISLRHPSFELYIGIISRGDQGSLQSKSGQFTRFLFRFSVTPGNISVFTPSPRATHSSGASSVQILQNTSSSNVGGRRGWGQLVLELKVFQRTVQGLYHSPTNHSTRNLRIAPPPRSHLSGSLEIIFCTEMSKCRQLHLINHTYFELGRFVLLNLIEELQENLFNVVCSTVLLSEGQQSNISVK